jgi:hypothetical protein
MVPAKGKIKAARRYPGDISQADVAPQIVTISFDFQR